MNVLGERFVLPALVLILGVAAFTNPMKWPGQVRVGAALMVIGAAIIVSYFLNRNTGAVEAGQAKTPPVERAEPIRIEQKSTGPNSPNIVGDNNRVVITQSPTKTTGTLHPSNDPLPDTPPTVRIPQDALRMYLGDACAYTTQASIVILRIAGKDLLAMKRSKAGLLINAKIFSQDGRIIADIEDNEFSVNPNNYFKIKRPDTSSLVVYDQNDNEALNVRYGSKSMLRVLGRFYSPRGLVQITPSALIIPGNNVFHFGYMQANGAAAIVFD